MLIIYVWLWSRVAGHWVVVCADLDASDRKCTTTLAWLCSHGVPEGVVAHQKTSTIDWCKVLRRSELCITSQKARILGLASDEDVQCDVREAARKRVSRASKTTYENEFQGRQQQQPNMEMLLMCAPDFLSKILHAIIICSAHAHEVSAGRWTHAQVDWPSPWKHCTNKDAYYKIPM